MEKEVLTPRSDAFYKSNVEREYASILNHDWWIFAKQLEKELIDAQKKLNEMHR